MDSDQESTECPLCLEVLEADDLNFFPCTCCYQICRFCWHRIRTDENGLCPACRKPYSENPAQFKPLTEEEIQQVRRDRKLKDSHKKPKITESRKHLANLRVVQRNLVFVNGLPSRLADTELLRRNDHFGKYGKIVKLVTSPAHNGQVNSICVYITYSRSEEALRAIQALCNYHVDGRTLKATLGTTKYCSRYLKGATCQKADCLYLHEPGDPLASFTKEQMQQGLHLEYERKLMEQYTNKQQTNSTSKSNRTNTDSSQCRIDNQQLSSINNSAITTNGHSDFESGDENQQQTINGFSTETFPNPTTINVDSDTTSTSSQTSSEHDQQSTTINTNTIQNYNLSPNTNWQQDRTSRFSSNTNNLVQSLSSTTPINSNSNNNNLLTESTNSSVKTFDQLPEYKLFSSNAPSIHHLLFGSSSNNMNNNNNNNNNNETNPHLTRTTLINGIDHDVREIEKRLMENCRINRDTTSYTQIQENDELGFDPCSLFMSALASDIEDEQKPLPTNLSSYRPTINSFNYSQQYSTTNPPIGQINPAWLAQQQQQQYHQYHDSHTNGTTTQKQQQQQQQQQQRYPNLFNGSSPRQMWNGTQQQQQQQQQQSQYASQLSARLDYSNQIQQRLPIRQVHSPSSSQYSQTINHPNSTPNTTTVTNNDRWTNLPWTDPAIISFGNKLDPTATSSSNSQWSSTTQSQGSSTLSSGTNLIPPIRWSQHPNVLSSSSSSSSSQSHLISNGIYSPYSTRSGVDDTNRS